MIALEMLISLLIVTGALFALIGSFGMLKLPDLMTRLHAPTKATTLGVGCLLIASLIAFAAFDNSPSLHELLITLFLLLTAPVTAMFIAKAYLHRHRDQAGSLPSPGGTARDWATFAARSEGEAPKPRL